MVNNQSHFVISLDFELMWGVRDHATIESYGANILGGRAAIPQMLDVFEAGGVHATWATVGLVFLDNKDQLLALSPEVRPTYLNDALSSYKYFDEVGPDERRDPYFYGGSLVRLIKQYRSQEIGSHSFSHYYCQEPGQTLQQFQADCDAAVRAAELHDVSLKSFVFPRNQYSAPHIKALAKSGISVLRGNEPSWMYSTASDRLAALKRPLRLADSYFNLSGANAAEQSDAQDSLTDIPASRFFRPFSTRLKMLEPLKKNRILSSMTQAAQSGKIYHLWWHPHNFGSHTAENIAMLKEIVAHFGTLRDTYGMRSSTMGDFGAH